MIVNFDEFNSIPGIFYHQANDLKDQPYLWKKENDKYVSLSWSQVKEQVESLATYLKDLGILSMLLNFRLVLLPVTSLKNKSKV